MGNFIDAVQICRYEEAARLLAAGASVNETDKLKRTALMLSVVDRGFEFAQILLKAGADVNLQEAGGWTALHFAAQNDSFEFVKLLLSYQPGLSLVDNHGNTSLYRAIVNFKGNTRVASLLIEAGADPNQKNNHGFSPKMIAMETDSSDLISLFT